MKKITVSAPGKLIIMGEHAVVYGRPCIVTAVNLRLKIAAEILEEPVFKLEAPEVNITAYQKPMAKVGIGEIPEEAKFAETALSNFMVKNKIQKGIKITTSSDFSSKIGLGSSSAIVVGVFKSLSELSGISITQKELFDISFKTVLDVQTKGSGFDVAAAIYGGTLYFKTLGSVIEPLAAKDINLLVGYSGVKTDTVLMVNLVGAKAENYKTGVEKIFDNIENLVNEAKVAILGKDWERVGTLMDYNQNYLEDLGVSTDKLNRMIEAAKNGGAYGAKLSGAGGGDCMIALVAPDKKLQIGQAITNAGGQIIDLNINAEGVKIESYS